MDCLILIATREIVLDGVADTSAKDRWMAGSYDASEGTVNSAHLKKPKKATETAAHSIRLSKERAPLLHTDFSFNRISGVMGR